jgi:hypothetical protein
MTVILNLLIDKATIIHIFRTVFICSFKPKANQPRVDKNIILIKNGVGNRPVDAVAAGSVFAGCRVLNPAPPLVEKDEMETDYKPLHFIRRGFLVLNIHPELVSGSWHFFVIDYTKRC